MIGKCWEKRMQIRRGKVLMGMDIRACQLLVLLPGLLKANQGCQPMPVFGGDLLIEH